VSFESESSSRTIGRSLRKFGQGTQHSPRGDLQVPDLAFVSCTGLSAHSTGPSPSLRCGFDVAPTPVTVYVFFPLGGIFVSAQRWVRSKAGLSGRRVLTLLPSLLRLDGSVFFFLSVGKNFFFFVCSGSFFGVSQKARRGIPCLTNPMILGDHFAPLPLSSFVFVANRLRRFAPETVFFSFQSLLRFRWRVSATTFFRFDFHLYRFPWPRTFSRFWRFSKPPVLNSLGRTIILAF